MTPEEYQRIIKLGEAARVIHREIRKSLLITTEANIKWPQTLDYILRNLERDIDDLTLFIEQGHIKLPEVPA